MVKCDCAVFKRKCMLTLPHKSREVYKTSLKLVKAVPVYGNDAKGASQLSKQGKKRFYDYKNKPVKKLVQYLGSTFRMIKMIDNLKPPSTPTSQPLFSL